MNAIRMTPLNPYFAARRHPRRHTEDCTKPKGMFSRSVCRALKPKPLMIKGPLRGVSLMWSGEERRTRKVLVTDAPVLRIISWIGKGRGRSVLDAEGDDEVEGDGGREESLEDLVPFYLLYDTSVSNGGNGNGRCEDAEARESGAVEI